MKFWVNGKLQGKSEIKLESVADTNFVRLGGRPDAGGKPVRALYDEVRVWNRALSAEEIAAHFNRPNALEVRNGLVLAESFDPKDGTSIALTAWKNAKLRIQLKGQGLDCQREETIKGSWPIGESKDLSLTYRTGPPDPPAPAIAVQVISNFKAAQEFPVTFEPKKHCFVATVSPGELKRDFPPELSGQNGTRYYDEFWVKVNNAGSEEKTIPFLLDLHTIPSITGLCPILCDKQGQPTGIPVQLSKNWHYGEYLMAYTLLPCKPGKTEYLLRVIYGFYGTLPSASHSQLCLVAYGGNGRWDQLAIGSWGETICFDMDMSCVNVAVTDVRMLMIRHGLNGTKWGWTDASWGGDWLGVFNDKSQKLVFNDMKTAYLSQGPCLTDVRTRGFYGAAHEVALDAQVQTLRTDDYARTFQNLKYTFNAPFATGSTWFYKMGGGAINYATPVTAYGNRDGLIEEQKVPLTLKPGQMHRDKTNFTGAGPWWVAFPGGYFPLGSGMPNGYRALVIRSYKATFGGKIYTEPTFSLPVNTVLKDDAGVDVYCLLTAPKDVTSILPGDTVEMELESVSFPRISDDYYGPNETFRQHLAEHPQSWETTYREASGNDLEIQVDGGTLLSRYPIVIQASADCVTVIIHGGVGFVPIRFEGLKSHDSYALYQEANGQLLPLDQSRSGNDFWQTDFEPGTRAYQRSYNLPLDNQPNSIWVLKHTSNP